MGEQPVVKIRGVSVRERPDPAPVLAIVGGMIAGKLIEHVVDMVVDKLMKPVDRGAELASMIATYKLYKGQAISNAVDAIRSAFFMPPREDEAGYNIDYDKFEEVIDKTLYATVILGALLGEDASELTMEMLQEALSNSLQYGMGGMWALMSATAAGFGVPQGLAFVGEEDIHPHSLANIDAWTGQLMHYLIAQHYLRVKSEWERTHQHEVERWLYKGMEFTEMPELHLAARWLARAFDVAERAADLVAEMAATMMRRVHDLLYSLQAAYNDYEAGILSDYEFMTIARSIYNAVKAVEEELDALLADAVAAGGYINAQVTMPDGTEAELFTALNSALTQTLYAYLDRVNETANREYAEKMRMYIEALRDLRVLTKSTVQYKYIFDGVEEETPQSQG